MSVLACLQIPVWNNIFELQCSVVELQCSVVILSFKFHYSISIFFHHLRSALQYEYNKHLIDTFCTNFFKYGVLSGPYFPAFERNTGNTDQKEIRIWTLFTCATFLHNFSLSLNISRVSCNYRGLFIKACSTCL